MFSRRWIGALKMKPDVFKPSPSARIVSGGITRIDKRKKRGVCSDTLRIDGLQLRGCGGLHVSVHIDVVQLPVAKRVAGYDLLNLCRERIPAAS